MNVPDEEILNLCCCYGKLVDKKVKYETLNIKKGANLRGGTRFVDVELKDGACFNNYYWLEGPLPGDKGKRVVVLHSNQLSQCSNCLRRASEGCPTQGIGKACERAGVPRTKMNTYMDSLRKNTGYTSLKIKHAELQAQAFPSLLVLPG